MNHPNGTTRNDGPAALRPRPFRGWACLLSLFLWICCAGSLPAAAMDADIVTGVVKAVDPSAGTVDLEVRRDSWLLAWMGQESTVVTVVAASSSWPEGLAPGMIVRAFGRYLADGRFSADVLQERNADDTGVRSRLGRGSGGHGAGSRGGGNGGGQGKGGGRGGR